tara:strand:- start:108 stop:911 length:804 start_codon:yes stop_codon:yes gene_type:complete
MVFKFAENKVVADITKVPEQFRCCYVEDGEEFKLDSTNPIVAMAVQNITSLTGTVAKLRVEVDDAKGKRVDLSPLSEWGESVDAILAKFTEERTELSDKAPKVEEWQAKLAQQKVDMANSHNAVVTARDTEITALKSAVEGELINSRALAALSKHKGSAELLMSVIKNHVKVVQSDTGVYSTQVVGADGVVRYNSTGEDMSLDELVGELKSNDVYAPAFASEAPAGTNTRPGSTNQRTHRPGAGADERSPTDKIAAGIAAGGAIRKG